MPSKRRDSKESTIEFQNLKNAIRSKNPDRLYFFHGEETFLMDHYLHQLKKLLIDDLTESFNYHRLTAETFNVRDFADAVENLPMMAEHTMVRVDEIDIFKLSESDRDKMVDILSDVPDYCTVVFTYETVAWNPEKRMKKLMNVIAENGTVVEFAKQNQSELTNWIIRHFAKYKKSISKNLCEYLIDITGGTMTAISGEIEKIAAFSAADEITKHDIDSVTEPVLDAIVFQMTDFLGEGRYGEALEKLQQLIKMQQEPIAILGAVGKHFRKLWAARILTDHGKSYGELMKICGMPDFAARKLMNAVRQFKPEFCRKALELVVETDYRMKTSFDDNQRLLELLILQLAQEGAR